MSEFWDGPVYDDVEREAFSDWLRERPDDSRIPDHGDEPYDFEHGFDPKRRRQELGIPEPTNRWKETP